MQRLRRANNLTTFPRRLSWNLEASDFQEPSDPLKELHHFYLYSTRVPISTKTSIRLLIAV